MRQSIDAYVIRHDSGQRRNAGHKFEAPLGNDEEPWCTGRHFPPSGMHPGISRWKFSMNCNRQDRDGDEEEPPSPAEGKAAVQRPQRGIHRSAT
jgi:hypothetical protein